VIGQHIDIESKSGLNSFYSAKCASSPEVTYPGVYEFLKTKDIRHEQLLSVQSIDRGRSGPSKSLQPQISGINSPNTEEALGNI
jgi:hypothetical protein